MRDGKWAYTIRAYRRLTRGGGLVLETLHATATSRDVEIAAFTTRMQRGEIDHIEVVSYVEPFGVVRIYRGMNDALHAPEIMSGVWLSRSREIRTM